MKAVFSFSVHRDIWRLATTDSGTCGCNPPTPNHTTIRRLCRHNGPSAPMHLHKKPLHWEAPGKRAIEVPPHGHAEASFALKAYCLKILRHINHVEPGLYHLLWLPSAARWV
jgi:hypothetical protein